MTAGDRTSRVIAIVYVVLFAPLSVVLLALGISRGSAQLAASGVALLAMAGFAIWFAPLRGRRGDPEKAYRLRRFAEANGWEHHPGYDDPALPGTIFRRGEAPRSRDLVRIRAPRFVEFGDFRHTVPAARKPRETTWGYVAVRLDAPLPHLLLDAVATRPRDGAKLPAHLAPQQRLSLEGDVDRHFSLFCPAGYETDALYLFTPDLLARLIDGAPDLDVEIVDDWLFLYAYGREGSTLDPARWAQLFAVVGMLLDRLAAWGRWRDERLTAMPGSAAAAPPVAPDHEEIAPLRAPAEIPRGVASPGRRLARRDRTVATVLIVVGAVLAGSIAFALPFLLG